ncbi:unnamed protein product [Eruca vesicaria subsp. sativa]|uniref:Uncharacterized protein n=1 Tax=Eruca vesicaria subsp. sativa TaxID=29727 RepID=A0ABC8KN79_ERUVS|nr:unnamed protein product [Eruca vesicaria subsp. sativa]
MGKPTNSAPATSSSKIDDHATAESHRMQLSDGPPEPTPPLNDLPISTTLPEVTEEIASFNTAQEKSGSDGSGENQGTSVAVADPPQDAAEPVHVPTDVNLVLPVEGEQGTSTNKPETHADLKGSDESPLQIVALHKDTTLVQANDPSEAASESSKHIEETTKDHDAISLGSSSEDTSEKSTRKKRVLQRLGLRSSKKQKKDESAVSPSVPQGASGSSRSKSKRSVGLIKASISKHWTLARDMEIMPARKSI